MNKYIARNTDLKSLLGYKDFKNTNIIISFTVLRFIAACLITNTHYNDVYPIESLAVGGLLGDVLFFIVSGFVLAKPTSQNFGSWYWKRIKRIYPTIFAGVCWYMLTGYRTFNNSNWFEAFIFPTFFVFVAAIILLYIPFYFVNRIKNRKCFLFVILGWIIAWLVTYFFFFDKSTYEMNNTNNPMIAFPYFTGMLVGAYLRKYGIEKRGVFQTIKFGCSSCFFLVIYFISTVLIRGGGGLYSLQIIVQITLLLGIALFSCMIFLHDDWFQQWPLWLMCVINFVSMLSLEIYVIQKPIISAMSYIVFPLNWILITASIVLGAVILRIIVNIITMCIGNVVKELHVRM